MSRLDSTIPQILGTDGDGRRKAMIDYVSMQPHAVRMALLIPNDATDPAFATRNAALQLLAEGWPKKGYQIDPNILGDENPLEFMRQRELDGISWFPALGMDQIPATSTGIATPDPNNVPPGAIITTTDFGTPNAALVVTVPPFKWFYKHYDPQDPHAVGTTYWAIQEDTSRELAVYFDGTKKYQKLSVVFDGSAGMGVLLWVRVK